MVQSRVQIIEVLEWFALFLLIGLRDLVKLHGEIQTTDKYSYKSLRPKADCYKSLRYNRGRHGRRCRRWRAGRSYWGVAKRQGTGFWSRDRRFESCRPSRGRDGRLEGGEAQADVRALGDPRGD